MLKLRKKKKWPWEGIFLYLDVGFLSIVAIIVTCAVIALIYHLVITVPIPFTIGVGVLISIVPIGYFVVHVLGWRP